MENRAQARKKMGQKKRLGSLPRMTEKLVTEKKKKKKKKTPVNQQEES
jgi:hypothetical protein